MRSKWTNNGNVKLFVTDWVPMESAISLGPVLDRKDTDWCGLGDNCKWLIAWTPTLDWGWVIVSVSGRNRKFRLALTWMDDIIIYSNVLPRMTVISLITVIIRLKYRVYISSLTGFSAATSAIDSMRMPMIVESFVRNVGSDDIFWIGFFVYSWRWCDIYLYRHDIWSYTLYR